MAIEIERKFLVAGPVPWDAALEVVAIEQGYLCVEGDRVLRVRRAGQRAWLTFKAGGMGIARLEYEYEIPVADALEMLARLCVHPLVEKVRHRIAHGGHLWEVDQFLGTNQGLVVAEIELHAEDEPFDRPDWLGAEVSRLPRYSNAALARRPFSEWDADERGVE
ncbi:MAG: CYTH domain-containing protein [Pseudomonadota bacterium]|nr:CYTH domain-containing protein [Pseudomonadota bacterium]